MDYSETVNLPKTEFSMKANLREKEPKIQAHWREIRLYEKVRKARKGAEKVLLHDGPPYATGDLHIGTVMNKVLKDFVVRYQTMCGKDSPFVPGWDCHGLPIEYKVMQSLGNDYRKKDPDEIRKLCREYAEKYVRFQKEQFCCFGILGDWDNPYLTMSPEYESAVMEVFLRILENGYIYRQLRPIHWCYRCETALAEAELEYKDIEGPSIYVRFEAESSLKEMLGLDPSERLYLLIWTTTPWTLPANVAVALGMEFDYAAVKVGDETLLLAEKTVERVMQEAGVKNYRIVGSCRGDDIEGMIYKHPFSERDGRIILADFVSLEQGTGMVHIAPGHGKEDYDIGQKYGLDVLSPVDEQGRFTDEFPPQKGILVFDADSWIIEDLKKRKALFASGRLTHSYPHCWRCGTPLIFRATKQWFISVEHEKLRRRLLELIKRVQWIPAWGKTRITAMVEQRPDWCISRQRFWGVPIPAVLCLECENVILEPRIVKKVKEIFAEEGADSWFKRPIEDFLPQDFKCPKCGGTIFEKEKDILDVWFESGSSYCPVLMKKEGMKFPADIYLEGSDQHRGWFQTSLLTSASAFNTAPFKTVITHGFVVDEQGKKMSKSLGNFISVDEVIKNYGADIVRLWIASIDYQSDINTSLDIIGTAVEPYRKIRNTLRYILGALFDFKPNAHTVPQEKMDELDRWALAALNRLIVQCRMAYENNEFHILFQKLYRFCVIEMSSFYFDVIKDRLYCETNNSLKRRSSQTALLEVGSALIRLLAPILVHTAEEAWQYLPLESKEESVHLALIPEVQEQTLDTALIERYEKFFKIRHEVARLIEKLRNDRTVGSSLEVSVELYCEDKDLRDFLCLFGEEKLSELLLTSDVVLLDKEPKNGIPAQDVVGLQLAVKKTHNAKCARCWRHLKDVGADRKYPDICKRCAEVIKGMKK